MLLPDDEYGGDPPCWCHLFEDEPESSGAGVTSEPTPVVDLAAIAASSARGPAWTNRSDDLDANLLVFTGGEGVAEHVNDQVDVLIVGIAGEGTVMIDGQSHRLAAGRAVLVPKGARRSTNAGADTFAYLTCHRRRPGLLPVVSTS
jgi:quercetin dioxygenase-like cupin family protein